MSAVTSKLCTLNVKLSAADLCNFINITVVSEYQTQLLSAIN
jgi:hypothetical protein